MKLFAMAILSFALAACGREGNVAGPVIPLVNADFGRMADDGSIPGWDISQHAGAKAYDVRIDADNPFRGRGSLRMTRTQEQVYGSVSQRVPVNALAGKTIEFSAMLKTRDVGARGWKLFVNGNVRGTLAYSPGLTGTNDWQRQAVRMIVPGNVRDLTVGVTLLDGGTGWMDDAELRVVGD